MADTDLEHKPRKRSWLKILALIFGVFLVLLVVAYFVVTSSAFAKAVILPRVGQAINAQIAVADLGLSPFSRLSLRDVKVTPIDAAPLLSADLVRVRYSLFTLLSGKIALDEVTIESPTITIVERADGTSNLDPLLKKAESKPDEKEPSDKTEEPPAVDIKLISLKNATISRTKENKDGTKESVELTKLNITASNIKNAGNGKLDLSTDLALQNVTTNQTDSLKAAVAGTFQFTLTGDLKPATVIGNATVAVQQAAGSYADATSMAASLDCELTPTDVKQIALRFSKADATLAELRVRGPFDAAKSEGKLKVELTSLDRKLLNLVGASSGLDFGSTTVGAATDLTLSKGGKEISLVGRLDLSRFQVTRQNQTTPTLNLSCQYDVLVDNAAQNATIKSLDLQGKQNDQALLRADLSSPMTIAWGGSAGSVGDAALNLAVTGLNFADWRAFAADMSPAGVLNLKAKILSQQAGKQLTFDVDGDIKRLGAKLGEQTITDADITMALRGKGTELKQFTLDEFRLDLAQQGQSALNVSGNGSFDTATQDANLEIALQAAMTRLLAMFPQPDAKFSSGALQWKGRIVQKQSAQSVAGQLALTGLTGNYGDYRFADFGTTVDLDVAMKEKQLEIRKATGELREGANPGGKYEVSGSINLDTKAGQLALKLIDFNQNGLRPFLQSALGDKKLVSVSINSSASANFAANGDAAIKGDLQLANLVVNDPTGSVPASPLEMKALVDAGVVKKVADIRQCQLTLTPTDRAKNQLNLTGRVDFSQTNATTGNIKLASDSLDVTRYYDLFAGDKAGPGEPSPTTKPGSAPAPAPAPPGEPKEPDPIKLPFRNFIAEAAIGRFYLREIDAQNIQVVAKLDNSHVLLKPAQLVLNGAPVSTTADLDLSVPGYKYDLIFSADSVPLTPLVNSFMPERKGQVGGKTSASAQIKGAGVTDASLQKNLSGQFNVMSTNLNLSVQNIRNPVIKLIINTVAAIPDLIRDPASAAGGLIGSLLGTSKPTGGWANELSASPIDVIVVNGKAGEGRVTLNQAQVRSSAFEVTADGNIALAQVLTNSAINIPVNVSLSRKLGGEIGLVTASTPTNAAYVPMPQFLTMKGTLGKPKQDINKTALVVLGASGIGKAIGGSTGEKVGGVTDIIGGLLGGKPPTTSTNAPTTNAPATNATQPNPINDLINIFGKPKR